MGSPRSRTHTLLLTLALLACPTACRAQAAPDAEAALWQTWKIHRDSPGEHETALAACIAFEKAHPRSPFTDVTRQLAAWHLLRMGSEAEARSRLLAALEDDPTTPIREAATEIARAWLTRFDARAVRNALQTWYRRHVAYPESLDALRAWPEEQRPPLADRWGRPWDYRLVGFSTLREMPDQKYALRCRQLKGPLSLEEAVARPYAGGIRLQPVRIRSAGPPPVVEFTEANPGTQTAATPVLLSPGARNNEVMFVYLGRAVVLLADGSDWKVLPRPR